MHPPVKRIGILTSGGDAPGMNAAIRAVVRTAHTCGIESIGIRRGYHGLIRSDLMPLSTLDVSGITGLGGTILYTARSAAFLEEDGQRRAADVCRKNDIEALVTIGGDGTFRGALDLSRHGIPVIGIPATIDNDIACTSYTIGYDTACNTAIQMTDKLHDTMLSHERCSVVEVMGHRSGYLALYVGIAVGATAILIPEREVDLEYDVLSRIRTGRARGRTHFMIIVAEGAASAADIGKAIADSTGIETRVSVLGHVQRGGSPNVRDRVTASRMGYHAVQTLLAGHKNCVICAQGDHCTEIDIEAALQMRKGLDMDIYAISDVLISGA